MLFDEDAISQQRLRDLIEHMMSAWAPELISGDETLQAAAAAFARASLAANRLDQGGLALWAEGGSRARCTVRFSRPDASTGDAVIKAGTIVADSQGRQFALLYDLDMRAGADPLVDGPLITVTGPVEAVATGWQWNVRGPWTTLAGESMPGEIDRIDTLITEPPWADSRFTVEQLDDATGGAGAMLDMLAEDKLLMRGQGEGDESLSYRVRNLPDTVSPGAVLRLLHAMLDPLQLPWDLLETFEHRYQECYDAPSPNPGTPSYQFVPPLSSLFNADTFTYDDPREPDIHHRNRTMDEREYRGAFVVVVRRDLTIQDTGFAYDDPAAGHADLHPEGGPAVGKPWRATPAYDLTSAMSPDAVFGCCYDGWDITRGAAYAAVNQQLQQVRAGGVAAVVDCVRP